MPQDVTPSAGAHTKLTVSTEFIVKMEVSGMACPPTSAITDYVVILEPRSGIRTGSNELFEQSQDDKIPSEHRPSLTPLPVLLTTTWLPTKLHSIS